MRKALITILPIFLFMLSVELICALLLSLGAKPIKLWDPDDHSLPEKSKMGSFELSSQSSTLFPEQELRPIDLKKMPLKCSPWTLFEESVNSYFMIRKDHTQHMKCQTPDGQLVFDVTETTDKHGFRRVLNQPHNPKRHLLTVGCSFIYGQGLNDNQTLASYLQLLLPDTIVYNASRPGGSISDSIVGLEYIGNWNHLASERGLALVFFSPQLHIPRLFPFFYTTLSWNNRGAALVWDPKVQKFIWKGSWVDHLFWVKWLGWLQKTNFFRFIQFEWPTRFNTEHFKVYAKALAQLKASYQALYPQTDFVVFTRPTDKVPQVFFDELDQLKVHYLYYGDIPRERFFERAMRIQYDGHPNEEWQQKVALMLATDLGLSENKKTLRKFSDAQTP